MPNTSLLMKLLKLALLLLTLALAAGQWAALAHSAEHATLQAHDGLCVLCVQSHNLEQAQTNHAPAWQVEPARFSPATNSTAAVVPARLAQANIRSSPHAIY